MTPAGKLLRIRAESSVTPGVYSFRSSGSALGSLLQVSPETLYRGALSLRWSAPPCPVLPTQHSAKLCDTHTFFAQVQYLLLLLIYRLFICGFGEFYFLSVESEWSVSICAYLFWSEILCCRPTDSECRIYRLLKRVNYDSTEHFGTKHPIVKLKILLRVLLTSCQSYQIILDTLWKTWNLQLHYTWDFCVFLLRYIEDMIEGKLSNGKLPKNRAKTLPEPAAPPILQLS